MRYWTVLITRKGRIIPRLELMFRETRQQEKKMLEARKQLTKSEAKEQAMLFKEKEKKEATHRCQGKTSLFIKITKLSYS